MHHHREASREVRLGIFPVFERVDQLPFGAGVDPRGIRQPRRGLEPVVDGEVRVVERLPVRLGERERGGGFGGRLRPARGRDRSAFRRWGAGSQGPAEHETCTPTTRSNRRSIHAQSDLFIPRGVTGCRGSRFPAGLRAPSGSEPGSGATQKYIDQAPLGGPLLTDRGLDINKTKNDINKLKVCFILCILT